MGKRASVQEGIEAVHLFRKVGIETSGFFIVGYPDETEKSIDDTLALASSLSLDEISINVPYPLPGSPLFSRWVPSIRQLIGTGRMRSGLFSRQNMMKTLSGRRSSGL